VDAGTRQRSASAGVEQHAAQCQIGYSRGWRRLLREHRRSCAGKQERKKCASHCLVDSDAYLTIAAGWAPQGCLPLRWMPSKDFRNGSPTWRLGSLSR
jgi:hypothetical protein